MTVCYETQGHIKDPVAVEQGEVKPGGLSAYLPEVSRSSGDGTRPAVLDSGKDDLPAPREIILLGHDADGASVEEKAPAMEKTHLVAVRVLDDPAYIERSAVVGGDQVEGAEVGHYGQFEQAVAGLVVCNYRIQCREDQGHGSSDRDPAGYLLISFHCIFLLFRHVDDFDG